MAFTRSYLLPGLVIFTLLGTFIVTYIISALLGHVVLVFPYISDTGTTPPESTIFSQLLNIGGVLIFITMYVRYLQIKKMYNDPTLPHFNNVNRLNRISVWLALFISLGTSMAGNFQETVALLPHMIGAFSCYFGATVYFCLQTAISYLVCPTVNTLKMARFRLVIALLACLLTATCGFAGVVSYFQFTRPLKEMPLWGPNDGGYELHLVSSFGEWICTLDFAVYFATFIKEFKNVIVNYPTVELKSEVNREQATSYNVTHIDKNGEDSNGNIGTLTEFGEGKTSYVESV